MSHLTGEQFEDMLRDGAQIPEHVDQCPLCRARLEEKRALAQRVRQAFLSLAAPAGLADQIRAGVGTPGEPSKAAAGSRVRLIPLYLQRHLWPKLAAVAALLALAVPIGFYVGTSSQANAAQVALVQIHHTNLDSLGQLVNSNDPNVLCEYLQDRVGHRPAMRCMGSGMNMCGCCVRQFQGRSVASYVIRSNNTPISVIAVPQPPETLGMTPAGHKTNTGRDIWHARHECCNMAAVRIGAYSYCAVGQVAQEELATILNALPGQAETLPRP
jgi:hypothetical protein